VKDRYNQILEELGDNLPTISLIITELIKRINDPDNNLDVIEEIILADPAISTEIIGVANTGNFRDAHEETIISIQDALQKLGLENVKKIALNASVLSLLKEIKSPKLFSLEAMWSHCVNVAIASESIARFIGFTHLDIAYTCGLVHDIGKIVKLKFNQTKFIKEVFSAKRKLIDLNTNEKARNLIRHDFLGGKMAKRWELPSPIIDAVTWHHEEINDEREDVENDYNHQLIDIVLLANKIVNKNAFGYSGHSIYNKPSKDFLKKLSLNETYLSDAEELIIRSISNHRGILPCEESLKNKFKQKSDTKR